MKLVRFGECGQERPGLIDHSGAIRDVSSIVSDFTAETLSIDLIQKLQRLDHRTLPLGRPTCRLGAPVSGTRNFVGVGLNYRDHAQAIGSPIPSEPILFLKSVNTIQGPCDPVRLPRGSKKSDWEVELGIVVGAKADHVSEQDAMKYVIGYCIVNDLSERSFQLERGGTWIKGKSCDTFGPIGPWLVTQDEISDPSSLKLWLTLNGQRMQDSNTREMIFGVSALVSYISEFITLYPGDIITTGTPDGVGMSAKPVPRFLRPGDIICLGIEGLGEQSQQIMSS